MQDNKFIKALIVSCQQGSKSAFEQLFRMTVDEVYALVYRLLGNSAEAEAMTKKAYFVGWQAISKKDDSTSIGTWLKKVAAEVIFKENKDSKKHKKSADKNKASATSLDDHIVELELRSRLVYVLYDVEKFSLEEISRITGLSEIEVKALLVKARKNLINATKL